MRLVRSISFGSDCSKFGDRKTGIWDQDTYRYGEILGGLEFGLTKEEGLDYRDSAMNHAMVIAGVNLDAQGKPDRWKIENSWGTENGGKKTGNNGYFVCSDEWFDNFVYEVAIRKDRLSPALQKALDSDPIIWPFWNTFNPVSA